MVRGKLNERVRKWEKQAFKIDTHKKKVILVSKLSHQNLWVIVWFSIYFIVIEYKC